MKTGPTTGDAAMAVRDPRYERELHDAAMLAALSKLYDPAKPADASEEALFFIWDAAVTRMCAPQERARYEALSPQEKRIYFSENFLYSYARFAREWLERARSHQDITLQ